jgi:hypothetical protein
VTGSARASGLSMATLHEGNGPVALAEPSLPGVRYVAAGLPREPTRKGRTFPELENTGTSATPRFAGNPKTFKNTGNPANPQASGNPAKTPGQELTRRTFRQEVARQKPQAKS